VLIESCKDSSPQHLNIIKFTRMSNSVNYVSTKYDDYEFPDLRPVVGDEEFERHLMYRYVSGQKVRDRKRWRSIYTPNSPISTAEMRKSLVVTRLPYGTMREPFTTDNMEVWRAILHLIMGFSSPVKYEFFRARFMKTEDYDILGNMVKFYTVCTGRSYEHFVPNVYFNVYRKRLNNCLRVQYATSASEGNLMDYWIQLPYSYDPKLYILIGFLLMIRAYEYTLSVRDIVSNSEMFEETIKEEEYHECGEFEALDPPARMTLDVIDLAFFEKYAPEFYYPTKDSLLALCMHFVDSNSGDCPYIFHQDSDIFDFSEAYPHDSEDGLSLGKFLKEYDPITSIMDRIAVNFR